VSASLPVEEFEDEDRAGAKVTLCHMPPGNPGNAHTITVGGEAHKAHLAHGDTLGECNDELLPPTKQEQQSDAFCERKPDHRRCEGLDNDEDDSASASLEIEDADDDADEDGEHGDDDIVKANARGTQSSAKAAFCDRKPDHQRCDDESDDGDD